MSPPRPPADERTLRPSALARLLVSADLRSLGLLRIVLGGLLAFDLVGRFPHVEALYSNEGVLSNHYALFRPLAAHQFSFYFALSSARDVKVAFVLTLVVYLLFAAGYRTRLFQVLSFICVTSLHSRNLLAELPSDAALHLWMAWSLFLPLGKRFSIDSLKRSLATRREKSPRELNERVSRTETITSIAVLGLVLEVSASHIAAGLRQSGEGWRDGTALYYALRQHLWVTDFGAWLGQNVPLSWLRSFSVGYRAAEIVIGGLVLVPVSYVRRAAVILLFVFHIVSRALWNFGPYDAVLLGAVPILISSHDWEALKSWYLRRKPELHVYFDADCGICLMICRVLARLDGLARLTFSANSHESAPEGVKAVAAETVVVRNEASGKTFTKARALAAILASLPLGKLPSLLLLLPGISHLADRAYELVARHRTAISVWFGYQACGVPRMPTKGPATVPSSRWRLERVGVWLREPLAGLFFVLSAIALARGTLETKAPDADELVYTVLAYPRLFQKWGIFTPDAPKRQGTIVVDAWTGRGTRIDPFTGGPPRDAPEVEAKGETQRRPSPLMSAYYTEVSQSARATYLEGLREYVTRLGDERDTGDKVVAFTVSWVETAIPPPEGAQVSSPDSGESVRRKLVARP